MREIKFRAWDKKEKTLHYATDDNCWWVIYLQGSVHYPDEHFKDVTKQCVLMQYIGLKDKNGKEIFEGDIVAYDESVMSDTGEDKPNYIEKCIDKGFIYADGKRGERRYGREFRLVEWKDGSCGFEPFSNSYENCGHSGGGKHPNGVEIIGNIYENSELLETKN